MIQQSSGCQECPLVVQEGRYVLLVLRLLGLLVTASFSYQPSSSILWYGEFLGGSVSVQSGTTVAGKGGL